MTGAGDRDLVIVREFEAPRALVYRAFLDPDELAAWFGPVGWSVPRDSVDVDPRVGGHQRFTMVSDDDPDARSAVDATFVELVENVLIVGEERVAEMPGFPNGLVLRVRIEFHDASEGRTRIVLRQGPYAADVEPQARAGWESSFTKLDALLAR